MRVVLDTDTFVAFNIRMEAKPEAKKLLDLLALAQVHIAQGVDLPTNASQLNTFAGEVRAAITSTTGIS